MKQSDHKLYKGIQGSYPVAVKVILKVGRECSIASRFGHGHLASSLISNAEPASLDPTRPYPPLLLFPLLYNIRVHAFIVKYLRRGGLCRQASLATLASENPNK